MTDSILVTLQPTIHKDKDAMNRLIEAIERKLHCDIKDIVMAIHPVQGWIKSNARDGKPTELRMSKVDGRLTAEVLL